jgi:choline dehydrogenase-like flavoprotein
VTESFDYVIVGAGAAGCVLANRLSADPGSTVLLLEAGGPDRHPFIHMPKAIGKIMAVPGYTWPYMVTAGRSTNGIAEPWLRGRTLGGSSSINGMMYVRGQAADYEALAAVTNEDWSWNRIGAAYKALENHELGADETRGDSGALHISMPTLRDPLTNAAIDAGVAMGMARKEDVNEPADVERIGYAPRTIYRGKRQSAAVAFLNPVHTRHNLTIVTGATVDKLSFEGKRAIAISGSRDGSVVTYRAKREILLCAGSMGSPAVLQRSGVGPAAHLRGLGIPVVQDSPYLGYNLREHRSLVMQWRAVDIVSQNREYRSPRLIKNVARYYLTRGGPMSSATYEAGAWFKTRPEADRPDAQFLIAPFTYDYNLTSMGVESHGGIHLCAYVLRPNSSGSVLIRSTDPRELPAIVANYDLEETDRRKMIDLMHYARRFMSQAPLKEFVREETRPGPDFKSDEEIIGAYARFGNGAYHASGSCSMGRDDQSVVDCRLRVRGIDGLRVVDTSILPFMVAGNTNGPITAVAWRAADLILADR